MRVCVAASGPAWWLIANASFTADFLFCEIDWRIPVLAASLPKHLYSTPLRCVRSPEYSVLSTTFSLQAQGTPHSQIWRHLVILHLSHADAYLRFLASCLSSPSIPPPKMLEGIRVTLPKIHRILCTIHHHGRTGSAGNRPWDLSIANEVLDRPLSGLAGQADLHRRPTQNSSSRVAVLISH